MRSPTPEWTARYMLFTYYTVTWRLPHKAQCLARTQGNKITGRLKTQLLNPSLEKRLFCWRPSVAFCKLSACMPKADISSLSETEGPRTEMSRDQTHKSMSSTFSRTRQKRSLKNISFIWDIQRKNVSRFTILIILFFIICLLWK